MNPVSTMVLALALLFGGAGAVFAFESAAQPDAPRSTVATVTDTAAATSAGPEVRPARRHHRPAVRWAPCPAGTTLVENACVTDVVKTVTLPAPAAQAVSHSSGAAASSQSSGDDRGDDHGDDRGEDRDDDHGHHGGEDDD